MISKYNTYINKMSFPVMLAKEYEQGMIIKKDTSKYSKPPIGWIASEKLDGYRCFFKYELKDNKLVGVFYSRNFKEFNAPEYFLLSMPSYEVLGERILDGELWAGRDNFELMGLVRKKKPIDNEWYNYTFTSTSKVGSFDSVVDIRFGVCNVLQF